MLAGTFDCGWIPHARAGDRYGARSGRETTVGPDNLLFRGERIRRTKPRRKAAASAWSPQGHSRSDCRSPPVPEADMSAGPTDKQPGAPLRRLLSCRRTWWFAYARTGVWRRSACALPSAICETGDHRAASPAFVLAQAFAAQATVRRSVPRRHIRAERGGNAAPSRRTRRGRPLGPATAPHWRQLMRCSRPRLDWQ